MSDAEDFDLLVSDDRGPVPRSYEVFADGRLVYQGEDAVASWWACVAAAKKGAKWVSCFVNGARVTFSRAV